MKKFTAFALIAVCLVFALSSSAKDLPKIHRALEITSEATDLSKAARDTHYLLGGPSHNADFNGTFQDAQENPAWNGFTSVDYTQRTEVYWHASDFVPVSGLYSAWCGTDFGNGDNGYGNGWNEFLELVFAVGNNAVATTVVIAATVNYNTEDGFDYSYLTYYKDGGVSYDLWEVDGWETSGLAVAETVTYEPEEYLNGNEIRIAWRLTSDGAWSSGDGLWPGNGGLWIDDCTVTITNDGNVTTLVDDYEDGTLGNWAVSFPSGVGDFAHLWTNLEDFDPCMSNYSPQVAFIDDGIVVPGTGGSFCQTWCYGPGGYIVTTTGGLMGSEGHIENAVVSPVMPWPDQSFNGCNYFFDVFRHEDLSDDSPGIFYQWAIRSITGSDPAAIEDAVWGDRNLLYYGQPGYLRAGDTEINNLLEPGRTFVQVRASVIDYDLWYMHGHDGYPAPYFDNFRLLAFPFAGPGVSYNQSDLAQDNFPTLGAIDLVDLENNHVRFDMAKSISPEADLFLNPGDSIVFSISPVREGATIDNMPTINYVIEPNSLFDSYRTAPTSGSVAGDYAIQTVGGVVDTVDGKYAFDLPDEGMLFPGDVLHYYIYAEDAIQGADVQSTTIPRDIDGFGDFSDPRNYHSSFTVNALPSLFQDHGVLESPDVLFWNDYGDRGGEDKWYDSFADLGRYRGFDYDTYFTQDPTSTVSNGLGSRATLDLLSRYDVILYSSGDLTFTTISNGDPNRDMGDDAGLIMDWLASGNKNLFATGDGLAYDLFESGPTTMELAQDWMGLNYIGADVRPSIGGQAVPLILRIGSGAWNPVFQFTEVWVAYGGCPDINTFDAVEPLADALRLAEFAAPSGTGGAYPFSAATLKANSVVNSHVITMPYDFMSIWSAQTSLPQPYFFLDARSQVLRDVMAYFGKSWNPPPLATPDAIAFSSNNYPNPFNPSTKIEFTMPKAGHLSLKIFNVRGAMVRTLVDGQMDAGYGFKMWDGTNEQGANVSSGVYFYEARTDSDVQVRKMALVK